MKPVIFADECTVCLLDSGATYAKLIASRRKPSSADAYMSLPTYADVKMPISRAAVYIFLSSHHFSLMLIGLNIFEPSRLLETLAFISKYRPAVDASSAWLFFIFCLAFWLSRRDASFAAVIIAKHLQ